MNPNAFSNYLARPIERPGVSAETLAANGVIRLTATEAAKRCGAPVGGLWIPYRKLDGSPIREENWEFGRVRLSVETEGKRYHSRAGSRSHLYMPARLNELLAVNGCSTLYITEGEFKSMSAREFGIPTAGVSGISNAAPQGRLVDELQVLLSEWPITRLIWIADSDAGIIADYSRAMVRLANVLPEDVSLSLIVPGLAAPAKGFDDLREKLGDAFPAYWEKTTAEAIDVPRSLPWEQLALDLLRRESAAAIAAVVNGLDEESEEAA